MLRSKIPGTKFLIGIVFLHTVLANALPKDAHNKRLLGNPVRARSLYEQYTLGRTEEGAKIIHTYQFTKLFNETQPEISLDFHYPDFEESDENDVSIDNPVQITKIELFVKSQDDSDTQAFVTEGGIGENNISLQIIAKNTALLNYMLVIYGKAA